MYQIGLPVTASYMKKPTKARLPCASTMKPVPPSAGFQYQPLATRLGVAVARAVLVPVDGSAALALLALGSAPLPPQAAISQAMARQVMPLRQRPGREKCVVLAIGSW